MSRRIKSVEVLSPYSKQQRPEIPALSVLDDARRGRISGQESQTPAGVRNAPPTRERVRVLSAIEIEELVACYVAGDSTYALSQRFAIARATVSEHLRRQGVMRRVAPATVLDAEQKAQVVELYGSGLSLKGVAKKLGISERAVIVALDEVGINRRPATAVLFGK